MKPKTGLVALCCMTLATVAAGEGVSWQKWSEDQFTRAAAQNRLVLLDLSAEWCAFCRRMEATTWKDPGVLAVIGKHYLPVQVVDEQDPELAERYRSYGRPAVVILDGQGWELLRKRGYLEPVWMQWLLEGMVQEQAQGDGS